MRATELLCSMCGFGGWGQAGCIRFDCPQRKRRTARTLDPALVTRTEAYVRGVLVDVFKQQTTDKEVREVALKIIANFPDSVKYAKRDLA